MTIYSVFKSRLPTNRGMLPHEKMEDLQYHFLGGFLLVASVGSNLMNRRSCLSSVSEHLPGQAYRYGKFVNNNDTLLETPYEELLCNWYGSSFPNSKMITMPHYLNPGIMDFEYSYASLGLNDTSQRSHLLIIEFVISTVWKSSHTTIQNAKTNMKLDFNIIVCCWHPELLLIWRCLQGTQVETQEPTWMMVRYFPGAKFRLLLW